MCEFQPMYQVDLKMKRRTTWLVAMVIALVGLVGIRAAYAYAAYHGTWTEQPTFGNHWWYNYSWGTLEWYADDYWSTNQADSMRYWHSHFPFNEYRIEQEAYDPGGNASCDRLHVRSYTWMDLPVVGATLANGCGSNSYKEELKIELNENAVAANTWLRHLVTYDEINRAQCSTLYNEGQVNYSFSHNHAASDSWLGKIVIARCFNWKYSDPQGMVN